MLFRFVSLFSCFHHSLSNPPSPLHSGFSGLLSGMIKRTNELAIKCHVLNPSLTKARAGFDDQCLIDQLIWIYESVSSVPTWFSQIIYAVLSVCFDWEIPVLLLGSSGENIKHARRTFLTPQLLKVSGVMVTKTSSMVWYSPTPLSQVSVTLGVTNHH